MNTGWIGIFLAGALSGSFTVPAKKIKQLTWSHTWLVYCVLALLVLPLGLAVVAAPSIFSVIIPENPGTVGRIALCGVAWGCGAVLFAVSIPRLGFALAYAIVCGVVTLLGSIGPLWVGAAEIAEGEGTRLAIGLGMLIVGIAACARASILRDRGIAGTEQPAPTLLASLLGVAVAILSGALSSLLNIGFAYGGGLIAKAVDSGIAPIPASMVVWLPALAGGFCINLIATVWKIVRAGHPVVPRNAPASDWLRASILGFLWFGAILIYSLASARLGPIGTVYGWAVNGGVAILTSAVWSVRMGEWDQADRRARLWGLAAIGLFLVAFAILATKRGGS